MVLWPRPARGARSVVGALAVSSFPRTGVLLSLLLARLSDPRSDRARGHSARRGIPQATGRKLGPHGLLARAHAALVEQRACGAAGPLLERLGCFDSSGAEPVAARRGGSLLGGVSLFRQRRPGLLFLPIRWDAACGGISVPVLRAARLTPRTGRAPAAFAGQPVSAPMALVSDLF